MRQVLILFLALSFFACKKTETITNSVESPGKMTQLKVDLDENGQPFYEVSFNGKPALNKSKLGIKFKEMDMSQGFTFIKSDVKSVNETWEPVLGEVAEIKDNYNRLTLTLINKENHTMDLIFKVYDDGIGLRYHFPEQVGVSALTTLDELTEFAVTGDHKTFWIPGDYDSNEHIYTTSKISEINPFAYNAEDYVSKIFTQHIVNPIAVQTPLTMKAADGMHICIHEAALRDYPALHLDVDKATNTFQAFLIPAADSTIKSVNKVPFSTPWRSVNLANDAAGLLNSKLILNLNDPNKVPDAKEWVKGQKYVGIWWLMHVGRATWDYAGSQDMSSATGRKPHGRHGATTKNTKEYIDFAAEHGFDGVLVEGWNIGWEDWFGHWKDSVFSFTTPYPDYDIDYLTAYAKEKGVKIIMHHETSSAVSDYERQMEDAYAYMNKYGMDAVKTGYVGKVIPKGEWHDGQWMINHYIRVAEATAKHKIMVNMHEAKRPTGESRTYPNWIACEASRGQEFNAWSAGNPPDHETILPFTRIMGGGFDYTPGIFETRMNTYDKNKPEVVHTTVAKQLALYVTLYSPLQMAADLPENYSKRLDIFQFIKDVPVDWKDSKVLNAEVGDYLTMVRKDKYSDNWFLGSITDEDARSFELNLDFLDEGATYEATIYEDGESAHWKDNPYPVNIRKVEVQKGAKFPINLVAGGGMAVSMIKK